jgi:hypothetical protein
MPDHSQVPTRSNRLGPCRNRQQELAEQAQSGDKRVDELVAELFKVTSKLVEMSNRLAIGSSRSWGI